MSIFEKIPVGASGTASVKVTRELTVAHANEHMPEVYATPMMIYLMELRQAKPSSAIFPKDGCRSERS